MYYQRKNISTKFIYFTAHEHVESSPASASERNEVVTTTQSEISDQFIQGLKHYTSLEKGQLPREKIENAINIAISNGITVDNSNEFKSFLEKHHPNHYLHHHIPEIPVPDFTNERKDLAQNIENNIEIPAIDDKHDIMDSRQNINSLQSLKAKLHPNIFIKQSREFAEKTAVKIDGVIKGISDKTRARMEAVFENKDLDPKQKKAEIIKIYTEPAVAEEIQKLQKIIPESGGAWGNFTKKLNEMSEEKFANLQTYLGSWKDIGKDVDNFGVSPGGAFAGAVFGFAVSVPWEESWGGWPMKTIAISALIFSNTYSSGYGSDMAVKILEGAGGVLKTAGEAGLAIPYGVQDGSFMRFITNERGKQEEKLSDLGSMYKNLKEPLKSYWTRIHNARKDNQHQDPIFENSEIENIAKLVNIGAEKSLSPLEKSKLAQELKSSSGITDSSLLKKYIADSALGGLHAYLMKSGKYRDKYTEQLNLSNKLVKNKEEKEYDKLLEEYNKIVGGSKIDDFSELIGSAEWKTKVAVNLSSASGLVGFIAILTQILAFGAMSVSKISSKIWGDGDKEKRDKKAEEAKQLRTYKGALKELAARGEVKEFPKIMEILVNPQKKLNKRGGFLWRKNKKAQGILHKDEADFLKKTLTDTEKKGLMEHIANSNLIGQKTKDARTALLGFEVNKQKGSNAANSITKILGEKNKEKPWKKALEKSQYEVYSIFKTIESEIGEKTENATDNKDVKEAVSKVITRESAIIKLLEQWGGEGFNIIDKYYDKKELQKNEKGGNKKGSRLEILYDGIKKIIKEAESDKEFKHKKNYEDSNKSVIRKIKDKVANMFPKNDSDKHPSDIEPGE